jgi:hypothetical protein
MRDERAIVQYRLVPGAPAIHTVPVPELTISRGGVTLALDDVDEHRCSLVFSPYQAVRVTTQDCFVPPPDSGFARGGLFVVEGSRWIDDLRSALAEVDRFATFLDQAHHFVVPSGDDIVEVVAWQVRWNGPAEGTFPASAPDSPG